MPKISVLLAQFPGGNSTHPDVSDWVTSVSVAAAKDDRIDRLEHWRVSTTPITMARNRAVEEARRRKVDYLLMVDSDMRPDYGLQQDRHCKPFWSSTLDWLFANKLSEPCVIAAPYCGPPPCENVYVFKVATWQNPSENPNADFRLEQFSREEAAVRMGFEQVPAIATGICLCDIRAFDRINPPYFYYEYKDRFQSELASTEDVTFSRDLAMVGVPVYINWDAWAGHHKTKCVGKPQLMSIDDFGKPLVEAMKRNQSRNERLAIL